MRKQVLNNVMFAFIELFRILVKKLSSKYIFKYILKRNQLMAYIRFRLIRTCIMIALQLNLVLLLNITFLLFLYHKLGLSKYSTF